MLVGSREGSPRTAESSSLPRLVISPTVCSGMINEQVLMCGSDSPVAPGQADIYGGAQTAGRPSKKRAALQRTGEGFLGIETHPPVAAGEIFSGSRSCASSGFLKVQLPMLYTLYTDHSVTDFRGRGYTRCQ